MGLEGLGNEGDKWGMEKMLGLQVPGTNLCVCVCMCTYYNAEQKSLKSPSAQPVILLEGLLCCPKLSDCSKNSFRSAV